MIIHRGKTVYLDGPKRLRLFFEISGGAYLKMGQILALRTDMLPIRYTDELLKLLSQVPATDYSEMQRVFHEELGMPPEEYFKEFNPSPIASASIGQVYRATLKSGALVAVKIQRPGIQEQFENDFHVAKFGADLLHLFGILSVVDWHEVVGEFINWTRRELDFTIEAKSAEIISNHSSKRPQTHIPKYYTQISTRRVLVSEFIENLNSVERVILGRLKNPKYSENLKKDHNIDLEVMAEYFIVDMIRQFFIDGFFHADPHPANIYLLDGNRLGYLDFGIIGEVGNKRMNMLRLLYAMKERDTYEMAKSFFSFARFAFTEDIEIMEKLENAASKEKYKKALEKIEEIMVDNLVEDLHAILDPWYSALDKVQSSEADAKVLLEYNAARVFSKIIMTAKDYSIYLPREVALFFRTISIVDMVALKISPKTNMLKAIDQFFVEFPLETAEELITEGTYEKEIEERIDPLHNLTYEEVIELKVRDQDRLNLARERLADLLAHYAERYDEVRIILKG